MNDTTQTLLRAVLKVGSGYVISKGIADENTTEVASAGIIALGAILWGILHRNANSTPTPPASTNANRAS